LLQFRHCRDHRSGAGHSCRYQGFHSAQKWGCLAGEALKGFQAGENLILEPRR
jgi:hypothetical protein